MGISTDAIHGGYEAANGEPRALPIYQSTTYHYDSTEQVAGLFDLTVDGHMYSRISNPTCAAVEQKLAKLEGGVGALLTSSGQAATLLSIINIASAGDHIVSASTIYGGTVNLFSVTLKRFGIECSYVAPDATVEEISAAIQPNTRAIFGETVANPALRVLNIQNYATVAHAADIPLIVDNTFATPALCRPIEHGADIVVHSTTKYIDGHALTVGGAIVDSGRFPWASARKADGTLKYPELCEPDESYHGLVYTEAFGDTAYITKARVQLVRDLGVYQTATSAFILNESLETLPLRMKRHVENAQVVAKWLEGRPEVSKVNYPGLPSDQDYSLAQQFLPDGVCGVISFEVKGGRERAAALLDAMELISIEVHVADSQTCVLHPASSTHRQLTDEQLEAAGVHPGLVRLSCGLEDAKDILADLEQAFAAIA